MLVFYHLGFNPKIYLGVIALINFHLGCSTPSHVLGRCPLFNLGLHRNVIVGFVLWAYYKSPFVPAVARLFCLALPGSFLTMFAQNKGDLCTYKTDFLGMIDDKRSKLCQTFTDFVNA